MKCGDLVQIKEDAYSIGYPGSLARGTMLVTEIIDELVLPDTVAVAIDGVAICISGTGVHRLPMEDLEVICESR